MRRLKTVWVVGLAVCALAISASAATAAGPRVVAVEPAMSFPTAFTNAVAKPTTITTTLSGEGKSGEKITVKEGTAVTDDATLSGENASNATGKIDYTIYSDKECLHELELAGVVDVEGGGKQPPSFPVKLPPGTYYWQAAYSGDQTNLTSHSPCGAEVETVEAAAVAKPTTLTTTLSGEGRSGKKLTVKEGTAVTDDATLSGENVSKGAGETATGKLSYTIYSDKECLHEVQTAGFDDVEASGKQPPSFPVKLAPGTYYWQAAYSGNLYNLSSHSTCGAEVEKVRKGHAGKRR